MKFLGNLLDKTRTNLELDRKKSTVQKKIQAGFERTWEEACLELVTHPQEYCLIDELLPASSYPIQLAYHNYRRVSSDFHFRSGTIISRFYSLKTETLCPDGVTVRLKAKPVGDFGLSW